MAVGGADGAAERAQLGQQVGQASAASNARRAGVAVHREHDALEPRAAVEVAADLLDLDPRRLVEREAADAGAEGDEREAARAELVRARSVDGGGAADDVRGRRPAELHRRGVDDPPARHVAGGGLDRLAEPDRGLLGGLAWIAGPPARRIAPATPPPCRSSRVGRVGDRVDVERRDVGVDHLDVAIGLRYRP